MNLDELRTQIDAVDDSLVELFQKRMDIAAQIAEYKRENGLPILQSAREREKLAAISAGAPEEMQRYLRVLYSLLFELSRTYQGALYRSDTDLYRTITRAIEETPKVFPKQAAVACQGVEGAYAQLACERLFSAPSIQFFRNFDGIFSAIEAGLCRYGILPIENSTAGSVRQVYDRMLEHHFYIVRSVRMKIDHCLLAKPGTKEIHEVFSHEQAINQCAEFLKSLGKDVRVTCCENTAAAAQRVAMSDRTDVAALSSRQCAELYGLTCLRYAVQDKGNNHKIGRASCRERV